MFAFALIGKLLVAAGTLFLFVPVWSTIRIQEFFRKKEKNIHDVPEIGALMDKIKHISIPYSVEMSASDKTCALIGVTGLFVGSVVDVIVFLCEKPA